MICNLQEKLMVDWACLDCEGCPLYSQGKILSKSLPNFLERQTTSLDTYRRPRPENPDPRPRPKPQEPQYDTK